MFGHGLLQSIPHQFRALGFRVLESFGFRVSGLGFRVQGFRFRV